MALENVTIRLLDAGGKAVAEQTVANLPGVMNWKIGEKMVTFKEVPSGVIEVEVVTTSPEITTRNNPGRLASPKATGCVRH